MDITSVVKRHPNLAVATVASLTILCFVVAFGSFFILAEKVQAQAPKAHKWGITSYVEVNPGRAIVTYSDGVYTVFCNQTVAGGQSPSNSTSCVELR